MATSALELCQQNAEEVKVLMKDNVEKVLEREGKLDNLVVRSDELKSMASNFQKTANRVELKTRWEKWRWYIIAGLVVLVVVIIIIIIVATEFSGGQAATSVTESQDP